MERNIWRRGRDRRREKKRTKDKTVTKSSKKSRHEGHTLGGGEDGWLNRKRELIRHVTGQVEERKCVSYT